jgi:hypothetical protein
MIKAEKWDVRRNRSERCELFCMLEQLMYFFGNSILLVDRMILQIRFRKNM